MIITNAAALRRLGYVYMPMGCDRSPWIPEGDDLMGGAAGGMKGGRHLRYEKPTPLANLHLTLLDKVGVRLDAFGDCDGKADELFEPSPFNRQGNLTMRRARDLTCVSTCRNRPNDALSWRDA